MKRYRQQGKMSNRSHGLRRAGFTLVELMVVVAIIAVLIGIITPAVQSARASARNAQCLNNIRNVGLAINNLATSNNGKYPYLEDGTYGWPVRILERFDQAALAREIRTNGLPTADKSVIAGFVCPDDQLSSGAAFGLSYAANAGYMRDADWGDPADTDHNVKSVRWSVSDTQVGYATGVFWRDTGDGFRMTIDYIGRGDGQTSTIMLAENIQSQNWSSNGTGNVAIGLSITVALGLFPNTSQPTGMFDRVSATEYSLKLLPGFALTNGSGDDNATINSNTGAAAGTTPRPSSNHAGSVNVAFCDGRAAAVDANIDPHVYARLISSNGTKHQQVSDGAGSY